jgi:hypothetical protein
MENPFGKLGSILRKKNVFENVCEIFSNVLSYFLDKVLC